MCAGVMIPRGCGQTLRELPGSFLAVPSCRPGCSTDPPPPRACLRAEKGMACLGRTALPERTFSDGVSCSEGVPLSLVAGAALLSLTHAGVHAGLPPMPNSLWMNTHSAC